MPEESKESKAKKLAAARKKLKEYQQRGTAAGGGSTMVSNTYAESSTNSGHDSSNISERSESDLHLNGSFNDINQQEHTLEPESTNTTEEAIPIENVNYFTMEQPLEESSATNSSIFSMPSMPMVPTEELHNESSPNINAIQVLITEKAQLTSELNKSRTSCREKDLELEELRVQHNNSSKRVDDLTQRLVDMQKQQEQQRLHNAELQHKLAQARAQGEDQSTHINELQQQLTLRDDRLKQLEAEYKNKSNELELSQLRIRQLSDENNITNDNRVETLTQTQFMYEQQIRDLQAMLQQLTQDKEQANTQYQTYVQQLNAQVQQLTERNNEVMDESAKLQEREKQWVDHIQQLEKEIQKNITRQSEIREDKQKETHNETQNQQLQSLQDRINEFDNERYEFQLKIKSQEDRLNVVQGELQQKQYELEQLREHLENVTSEQPDKTKLLATMESDKVAASRALSQNVELKKQLDELELRFVQLTNDKADLMNRLDSEQYANREMHTNYAAMEERLKTNDERFKFKDEEMIRLSIENEELKKELQEKVYGHEEYEYDENSYDQHDHQHDHEHHEHHDHDHAHHDHGHAHHDHGHEHKHHDHEHEHKHHDNNDHEHEHHDDNGHEQHHHDDDTGHTHLNDHHKSDVCPSDDHESCHEVTEEHPVESPAIKTPPRHKNSFKHNYPQSKSPHIATEEAVEKLQQRFTQLMSQCADLTEEKQRLEHLVMQLQSETETIGEYITLYQNQRRILKQREYEKAAQTAMLQEERAQMRDRLTMLNNLVNSLGMELPQNQQLKQQLSEALAQSVNMAEATTLSGEGDGLMAHNETASNCVALPPPVLAQSPTTNLKSLESQQILHKIQDIITEIKENTKELPTLQQHSVDHLNCCSGKFEVV